MSTKRKAPTRPGNMKSGEFQTEAERDSGFSDASSEHLSTIDATDSEDSPGPVRPSSSPKGTSSNPGTLTVVGGAYSNLSSMIIMNNVVLKQPGDPPPPLKPWRFSPAVEVVQPVVQQPQVVFLQPVVSHQNSNSKTSSKHRRSKKYLPILKSYPKIAPRDSSSSSGRGTSSSSTSSTSSGSPTTSDRCSQNSTEEKSQRSHSNAVQSASSNLPLHQSTVSPLLKKELSLPSMETTNSGHSKDSQKRLASSSELATAPSFAFNPKKQPLQIQQPDPEAVSVGQPENEGDDDVRRKRFCNTYNILSKSGLLDITLRTKELLRQNKRTQTDIDRLKEQTDLFLQVLRSGDTGLCVKLQRSLQEDKDRDREGREGNSEQV
ncbi:CLOCK-interacting pacemaker [Periophthalmus magnuspinnatus]|uniref:CLOCK-interacting pacemaker n=1 Tax=Periophthalmus magnuspinnatus TaxID=409849 RepID=UPI00145B1CD3|nr:CLOCK-interacting pacemaker [Periophthalmus magnuspinnatus]